MSDTHHGSCACGTTKYSFNGPPQALAACHCTPCRKTSSNSHSSNFMVPRKNLSWTAGSPRKFTRKGDSGADVTYNYCSECPTVLIVEAAAMPDIYIVKAGGVDDLELLHSKKYDVELYTKNRYPFLKPFEGAQQTETQ